MTLAYRLAKDTTAWKNKQDSLDAELASLTGVLAGLKELDTADLGGQVRYCCCQLHMCYCHRHLHVCYCNLHVCYCHRHLHVCYCHLLFTKPPCQACSRTCCYCLPACLCVCRSRGPRRPGREQSPSWMQLSWVWRQPPGSLQVRNGGGAAWP